MQINCDGAHKSANNHKISVDTHRQVAHDGYVDERDSAMYTATYAKNGDLKHSDECTMAFGHKDSNCPRCVELLAGSAPRKRFGGRKTAAEIDAQRCVEIKAHFASARHLSGGCGPVCTFGEW